MKIIPLIFITLLVFAACGPTPSPEAASVVAEATKLPATSMPVDVVTLIPAQEEPTAVPAAPISSGEMWLQVLSPLDEAVLDSPEVEVIGMVPAGSVVSVNDEILLVGEDGKFEVTIPLDEGPNLIEIVASDMDGNEVSQILTVVYEP